ncbi:hypothetical protein CLAIMM_03977 [Cladophialophora immunda]|nr:hypothetical protein CLAIMM_03977 [Cladophialophora immunda]
MTMRAANGGIAPARYDVDDRYVEMHDFVGGEYEKAGEGERKELFDFDRAAECITRSYHTMSIHLMLCRGHHTYTISLILLNVQIADPNHFPLPDPDPDSRFRCGKNMRALDTHFRLPAGDNSRLPACR